MEPIQSKKSTFSVWPTNAGQARLFLQPATTGAMCCYLAGSDKSLNKFHDTGHIEWAWHAQTKICVLGWGVQHVPGAPWVPTPMSTAHFM